MNMGARSYYIDSNLTVLPLRMHPNRPSNAVAMPVQAPPLIISCIQPRKQHLGKPKLREVFDAHGVELAD